jgi:hypothetical protein
MRVWGAQAADDYRLSACAPQKREADPDLGVRVTLGVVFGVTVATGVAAIVTSSNALLQWGVSTRWDLICFNSGDHNRPAVVPHDGTLPIITSFKVC